MPELNNNRKINISFVTIITFFPGPDFWSWRPSDRENRAIANLLYFMMKITIFSS